MRQMRKLHQSVITTYMNIMLLVIMVGMTVLTGTSLTRPLDSFTWQNWVSLCCLAGSNVGSQTFRFLAIQRSPVTRLQNLASTQTLFQFMADLLIFAEKFSSMQIVGISIVFGTFLLSILRAITGDLDDS